MNTLRVGFSTIYSWRPHVEHAYFLAGLLKKAGHQTFFLTCDADLQTCYTQELRGQAPWRECLKCRAGGVRSYTDQNVESLGRYPASNETVPRDWAASSASTLGRFESNTDYESEEFEHLVSRLHPVVQRSYDAARAWIQKNKLDAVCVFNGRMDATRGIFEAAKSLGVLVVSLERTWFGDGLQLYPEESCIGLNSVHRLMAEWAESPLTESQAICAASYAARRFLKKNEKEWRAYNINSKESVWPVAGAKRRLLLLPSSRNEIWGHADWVPGWAEPTDAYDALIVRFGLQPTDLVLRCHPNWSETIGRTGGEKAENYYLSWAKQRGVHVILSADNSSTLDLIQQCDGIVVSNGSAALEAGILGKQIISTAPSIYQNAGFRDSAMSMDELDSLKLHESLSADELAMKKSHIAKQTLRFAYTMMHRIPQYTEFVRTETTTKFNYDTAADPQRFIDLLRTGELRADDLTYSESSSSENEVLKMIEEGNWQQILDKLSIKKMPTGKVKRRWLFEPINLVRNLMPIGDK
jgi:hypothetical protein